MPPHTNQRFRVYSKGRHQSRQRNEITVAKPRTSGRQRHTENATAETIKEHFRYQSSEHQITRGN
jgi:hypothetical protein